jgi:hypothetical protein
MANEVIPYLEMCQREGASLQRGMNFNLGRGYSVILMSVRRNAPYRDRFGEDESSVIYEGHDVPRGASLDPKLVDQVDSTPSGLRTQNGLFWDAVISYRKREGPPHIVKIYEKIHQGIWSYNGLFHLVDAWREQSGERHVFKFRLNAIDGGDDPKLANDQVLSEHRRLIPTPVKVEVWNRDRGMCVICGATTELHFDHVLPYSRGGTSLTAHNVQLLCARHNLSKGAKLV